MENGAILINDSILLSKNSLYIDNNVAIYYNNSNNNLLKYNKISLIKNKFLFNKAQNSAGAL